MEFDEVREYAPGRRRAHHRLERHRAHRRRLRQAVRGGARADGDALSTSRPRATSARAGRLKREAGRRGGRRARLLGDQEQRQGRADALHRRVEQFMPPRKGTRHVLRVVARDPHREPEGSGTDLAVALDHLGRVHKRTRRVFLISDFLATGYEQALRSSRGATTWSRAPARPARGDAARVGLVELEDPETGARRLSTPATARARAMARRAAARRRLPRGPARCAGRGHPVDHRPAPALREAAHRILPAPGEAPVSGVFDPPLRRGVQFPARAPGARSARRRAARALLVAVSLIVGPALLLPPPRPAHAAPLETHVSPSVIHVGDSVRVEIRVSAGRRRRSSRRRSRSSGRSTS